MHLEIKETTDWEGRKFKKKTLIFPRYHQWDVVRKLAAAARAEGAGGKIPRPEGTIKVKGQFSIPLTKIDPGVLSKTDPPDFSSWGNRISCNEVFLDTIASLGHAVRVTRVGRECRGSLRPFLLS